MSNNISLIGRRHLLKHTFGAFFYMAVKHGHQRAMSKRGNGVVVLWKKDGDQVNWETYQRRSSEKSCREKKIMRAFKGDEGVNLS
jgi:hypothetical protein